MTIRGQESRVGDEGLRSRVGDWDQGRGRGSRLESGSGVQVVLGGRVSWSGLGIRVGFKVSH